uniref:Uncharacterized protein n=1 Tax=Anguilla anguilla TaxID=7936 RepID=A0A0E9RJ69_ANGAN
MNFCNVLHSNNAFCHLLQTYKERLLCSTAPPLYTFNLCFNTLKTLNLPRNKMPRQCVLKLWSPDKQSKPNCTGTNGITSFQLHRGPRSSSFYHLHKHIYKHTCAHTHTHMHTHTLTHTHKAFHTSL